MLLLKVKGFSEACNNTLKTYLEFLKLPLGLADANVNIIRPNRLGILHSIFPFFNLCILVYV